MDARGAQQVDQASVRFRLQKSDPSSPMPGMQGHDMGYVPEYMDALMRLLAASGDPALALRRWKEAAERNGFSGRWTALRELDRRLLSNVAQGTRAQPVHARVFFAAE